MSGSERRRLVRPWSVGTRQVPEKLQRLCVLGTFANCTRMPPRPSLAVSQPTRATANFTQRFTVTREPPKPAIVRPDMIKGAILERQGERIRLSDLDPVPEPAACSQNSCRFHEVGCQIDRRHPTTAFGCEIARRAAKAATDLEHVHAGFYPCAFRMLASCRDAPAVQLIERP